MKPEILYKVITDNTLVLQGRKVKRDSVVRLEVKDKIKGANESFKQLLLVDDQIIWADFTMSLQLTLIKLQKVIHHWRFILIV